MRTHGTCIVGIAHGGAVWMGCDSMASGEYVKHTLGVPKIVRVGEALFGVCGAVRTRDIVEFVTLPERAEGVTSDREYLVRSYIPQLRGTLKDSGALSVEDGVEEYYGGILLGYRGKIYHLDQDFALMEHERWAIGSGAEYALGSLYSTKGEPKARIKTALQAACEFSPSCAPPFHIEKL